MTHRRTVLFFVGLFLLLATSGGAQDFKRQYKNAKDLFDEKKYSLAMEAFKGLIVYDESNPYSQYASYFYALSAYQQGYQVIAKDMLVQIRKLYPQWEKLDEVNYWLAKIYFDEHEYFQAMALLRSIKAPGFQQDVDAMEKNYIRQLDDPETLKMLFEEHPSNAIIARALATAIAKQPLYQQDVPFFDSIINQFNFNRTDFISDTKPLSVKKDKYRVALLFPFLANAIEPTPAVKANQFILDLYQGMRLAVDTLAKQSMPIELLAYDVERNIDVLKRLLETDELKSVDIIVGPLLGTEETRLVQDFSLANKIIMINPVTNNSAYLGQNPFAMLYQPSHETLGRRSAEAVAETVSNKNCWVYYGDAVKDSVMAFNFMKRALELGVKVLRSEEIRKETATKIQPTLVTPTEYDDYKNPIQFKIKRDSLGAIYVASDDVSIYSKVISSVQTRKDSTVVFGLETWAAPDNSAANYDTFERLRVTMAGPTFASLRNGAYLDFRDKFLRQHGQLPSMYARVGFEFMEFLAKNLFESGTFFQEALSQKGYFKGSLGEGYDFSNGRDNQYVPFLRFQGGILEPTDRLSHH